MSISDDDLDRIFRAAVPAQKIGDARLTASEVAIREGIIRGTWASRPLLRRRPMLWASFTTATAAVVAVALVAVNVLMPSQKAVALTPPPLEYSTSAPLDDVIADAQQSLRAPPVVASSPGVHSVVWGWSAEMETGKVEITPQDVTFVWSPGGPAMTTIVAGDSSWPENERPEGVGASPHAPGELISRTFTPATDFSPPPEVMGVAGGSSEDLTDALAVFGAASDSSSGDLLAAITGLLDYWALGDEQHGTLLHLLVDAGGVTVRGQTTDRLGRGVVGLQVASVVPERLETVFVSTETGRIVGVESELIKPLDMLPAGVITYTMWDAGN